MKDYNELTGRDIQEALFGFSVPCQRIVQSDEMKKFREDIGREALDDVWLEELKERIPIFKLKT